MMPIATVMSVVRSSIDSIHSTASAAAVSKLRMHGAVLALAVDIDIDLDLDIDAATGRSLAESSPRLLLYNRSNSTASPHRSHQDNEHAHMMTMMRMVDLIVEK